MSTRRKTLAEMAGIGKVVICQNCDQVHLKFGRMTLDLSGEEFLDLSRLIGSAEKNFISEGKRKDYSPNLAQASMAFKLTVVH